MSESPPRTGPSEPPPGPARRPGVPRAVVGLVVVAAVGAAAWAFAASRSDVEAAPGAGAPECATLLAGLPQELTGLARDRDEAAAGTAVWGGGRGEARVVLRCGGRVLGPTTEPCVPVGPDEATSVDWVRDAQNERAVRFLTYGRDPAVEVTVRLSAALPASAATSALVDLAAPVAGAVEQTRTCL